MIDWRRSEIVIAVVVIVVIIVGCGNYGGSSVGEAELRVLHFGGG